jgi:hypothetical protein
MAIAMPGGTFVINRVALRQTLFGNTGPVGRDLALKSQRVVNAAKRLCPVDTSRLRASIRYQLFFSNESIYSLVGTDVAYALFVHEDTRPHWPPLSAMQPWAKRHGFPEGDAGAWLVGSKIAHQGTAGVPFLTDALRAVGVM